MTDSLRGLFFCSLIAAACGLWWGLGGPAAPVAPQGWRGIERSVDELRWNDGGAELVLRRRDGQWHVVAPRPGPAASAAVDEWLSTLAAARWHRRAQPARAGALVGQVLLDGETLAVGQELGEQQWLVWRGSAWLVDRWLARRLLDPTALRDRAALGDARAAAVIEVHGAGPWRSRELVLRGASEISPTRRRVDPVRAAALRDALAALVAELDRPAPPTSAFDVFTVRVAGGAPGEAELWGGGACVGAPAATAVRSSRLGAGCVRDDALRALGAAIDAVTEDAALDPRPAAAEPVEVVGLALGAAEGRGALALWRDGGVWQERVADAGREVDSAAVAALVESLTERWRPAAPGPEPAAGALTVSRRDGSSDVLEWGRAGGAVWLRRRGEPARLWAPPSFTPPTGAGLDRLRRRALLQLEPSSVTELVVAGQGARRGEVLSEWMDERGAVYPAAVVEALEGLIGELGALRASPSARPLGAPVLPVRLTVAPPPSRGHAAAPSVVELGLWATPQACLGTVAEAGAAPSPVYELAGAVCARAHAAARALSR